MPVEIKWIGHASFRLSTPDSVVYIDPWKVSGAPGDADVVFVSHSHYDHCSPDDVRKVSKADTTVIAPADTIAQLHAANAADVGENLSIGGVTVETVAAYNVNKAFHPRRNNWMGAVFTLGGTRIYYAGDTDLIPEMSDLADIDVALLPVGGTYTLNAAEAAQACKAIGCKNVIPYHWGDIVGSAADARKLAESVDCCRAHVLQPGGSVTI